MRYFDGKSFTRGETRSGERGCGGAVTLDAFLAG